MCAAGALRGCAGVHHGDRAPGPGQDQGRRQTGGAAADDHHVVCRSCHRGWSTHRRVATTLLLFPGNAASNGCIVDASDDDRRRARPGGSAAEAELRTQRGITLTELAEHDRHLQEHAVAAGDRPAAAEPRAAAPARPGLPGAARRPRRRAGGRRPPDPAQAATGERPHGAATDPAARRRAGVEDRQSRVARSTPKPRMHEGYEWLYVLSGRMRLILGDQDLVLGVGEAAEFDTQVPALVRQHRRGTSGGAEPLRPPGRANAPPHEMNPKAAGPDR